MGNVYITLPCESKAMLFDFNSGMWVLADGVELGAVGSGAAMYAGRWCVVHATDRSMKVKREDVQAMMVGAVAALTGLCERLYDNSDSMRRYASSIPPYMVDKLSTPRCSVSLELQSVLSLTDCERLVEMLAEFISKTATLASEAVRAYYCKTMLEQEPRRAGAGIHRYDIPELVNLNMWPLCPAAAKYIVEEHRWSIEKQMGPKPEYRIKAGNWCSVTASSEPIRVSTYLLEEMLSGLLPAYYELCEHCASYVERGSAYLHSLPDAHIDEQSVVRTDRYDADGEISICVSDEVYRYSLSTKRWSGASGVLCGQVMPAGGEGSYVSLTGMELCELVASFIESFASMQNSNVRIVYVYNMLEGCM